MGIWPSFDGEIQRVNFSEKKTLSHDEQMISWNWIRWLAGELRRRKMVLRKWRLWKWEWEYDTQLSDRTQPLMPSTVLCILALLHSIPLHVSRLQQNVIPGKFPRAWRAGKKSRPLFTPFRCLTSRPTAPYLLGSGWCWRISRRHLHTAV